MPSTSYIDGVSPFVADSANDFDRLHYTIFGDPADAVAVRAVIHAAATTKGDVLAATASATLARLAVGANGKALVGDSSTSTGLAYKYAGFISKQYITALGVNTHTVPAGARWAHVRIRAAGASGGVASVANVKGGGGGQGELREAWLPAVPGTTVTVTLNAGGAAQGLNNNAPGANGGTSVWSDTVNTITPTGGFGGSSGNNGGASGQGGSGGTGGDIGYPGQPGQVGADSGGTTIGLNASGGGDGGGVAGTAAVANSGAGGGSGSQAANSGAGALGYCLVEYFGEV